MSELVLSDLYQGFRDPETIKALLKRIAELAPQLDEPLRIMEVCGGHTHSIMKYGIHQSLPDNIEFIHGPGCPVCVMPKERIDQAITLANQPNVILTTLGDMIRVPGSNSSLAQARAQGCDVRALYDPMDAVRLAQENPDKIVVFFAIGFETTSPMTAVLVQQIEQHNLHNLLLHVNHVLVPPAVHAVMADGQAKVNAFIGPSHVSVITGAKVYQPIVDAYQTPVVVSGFEPVDVLQSVLMLLEQMLAGEALLEIQYDRAVTLEGNHHAQALIEQYLTLRQEFRWRGLGNIPYSALELAPAYQHLNAESHFADVLPTEEINDHKACQCGDILKGLAKPSDCKVFGRGCTPETPMGSCMVSSEGACHAHYKYAGVIL
ncbi:Hydrogenase maturation protein HypD [Ferrimonas sediminum]|uniref:Hydrogenase maturation factor n=1 Tax=Ferrimonas sediminum TaxID=718193 RepID=A0A1G8LY54_9GAMM|nr:hydrogenase formation protein HypD [Ferrimonas sediminum]SDI60629.1 Hydrogenase maturation protein HypD [Ferrimonas sediminum]